MAEDDRAHDVVILLLRLSFGSDKASLLSVLQVVAVALGNEPIHSLLDPNDFIDNLVALRLHHLNGKPVLGVDDPDKEEAVSLELFERNLVDDRVWELLVGDSHSSSGISRAELPWRIAGDHIEQLSSMLPLGLHQLVPLHLLDVDAHRDAPELLDVLLVFEYLELPIVLLGIHLTRVHVLL